MRSTILILVMSLTTPVLANQQAWIAFDEIDRVSCPAPSCGVIGQLMKNEQVTILEEKDGWSRISIYYDAGCRNGMSVFISQGNRDCIAENGIYEGKVAEWVKDEGLTHINPKEQLPTPKAKYDLIRMSDDFEEHKDVFADAAQGLINSGRCVKEDFEKIGGWMSSSNYSNRPIYFIYCGGKEVTDMVHIDVSNGRIW